MRGMDYRRAREVLRERRFELRIGVQALATKADVERTTVYRVENTKELPEYRPDFETLEKLAVAMGLTLSDFFVRIEDSTTAAAAGTNAIPKPRLDGAATVSRSALPLDDVGALLARNTAALDELIEAVRAIASALHTGREQTASPRAHKSASHAQR